MTKQEIENVVRFLFPSTPQSMIEDTIKQVEEKFITTNNTETSISYFSPKEMYAAAKDAGLNSQDITDLLDVIRRDNRIKKETVRSSE